MKLTLDPASERLRISQGDEQLGLRGKSVSFVCLLITLPPERFADRELVHRLPRWSGMTADSVGKQVARLDGLWQQAGFDLIDSRNRTNGWRLNQAVRDCLEPDVIAAAHAMLERVEWTSWSRFAAVSPAELADWAIDATEAGFRMMAGQAEQGYELLRRAYDSTAHPDLMAIADVLASRIGQRLSRPHLPLPPTHLQGNSLFETAVEVRRQAAYAINAETRNWEAQARTLRILLPSVVATGDMTSQAIVHNALALLMRRLGAHDEALSHMREAVPLAIFSGDHWMMQAALFNLANILSELRRAGKADVSADQVIALLEADRSIRNRFKIGRDSAQAELLLAYLAYEAGLLDQADAYLAEADTIIADSRVTSDQALAQRIRGLLTAARGDAIAAAALLEQSTKLFEAAGNHASADWVRNERDEILRANQAVG